MIGTQDTTLVSLRKGYAAVHQQWRGIAEECAYGGPMIYRTKHIVKIPARIPDQMT